MNDFLDSLVDKTEREEAEKPQDADIADKERKAIGLGAKMQGNLIALMQRHFLENGCWRGVDDMPNPENLKVRVRIRLTRDGKLAGAPQVLDGAASSSNSFLQAAAGRARSAVIACEPYDFLPIDQYEGESGWADITYTFGPKAPP